MLRFLYATVVLTGLCAGCVPLLWAVATYPPGESLVCPSEDREGGGNPERAETPNGVSEVRSFFPNLVYGVSWVPLISAQVRRTYRVQCFGHLPAETGFLGPQEYRCGSKLL